MVVHSSQWIKEYKETQFQIFFFLTDKERKGKEKKWKKEGKILLNGNK